MTPRNPPETDEISTNAMRTSATAKAGNAGGSKERTSFTPRGSGVQSSPHPPIPTGVSADQASETPQKCPRIEGRKPRLIDLCCKAGGAAMGYARAGFEVVGVDIEPQPNYPFEFIQADAMSIEPEWIRANFHAAHASPPCQEYTPLKARHQHKSYPDLVAPMRLKLTAAGVPWVMENVMSAPLIKERSIVLCGGMFGLRTYRHRRFECSTTLLAPEHPPHVIRTATKQRKARWAEGWHVSITGDVGVYLGPEAMGIDWMTGDELCEAIPPAYTQFIGHQLMAFLQLNRPDRPLGTDGLAA